MILQDEMNHAHLVNPVKKRIWVPCSNAACLRTRKHVALAKAVCRQGHLSRKNHDAKDQPVLTRNRRASTTVAVDLLRASGASSPA